MDAAALQRKGYSVAALRALAKKLLPRMVFDMVTAPRRRDHHAA